MNLQNLIIGLVATGIGIAGTVRAADVNALKQKRDALQTRQAAISKQLGDVRKEVEKLEAVTAAQQAAVDAKRAYDAKIAASVKIAPAKKAAEDATAAARAVAEAEMSTDHDVLEAQEAHAAADDAVFEAESQLRIAGFVMSELKRRAARDVSLKPLKARETKATEAYYAARQANKDVEPANTERAAATTAYEDALAARLAASPDGQAQATRIAELEAKVAEARAAAEPVVARLQAARAEVSRSSAKIAAARARVEEALAAVHDATMEAAGPQRAQLDRATQALDETVKAKLDANPRVAELRKQLDDLRREMNDLAAGPRQDATAK